MDAATRIDISSQDSLPIIKDIVRDIPWLEGDLAIEKYIENAVLKLLRNKSSSQALYDLYMFLVETKSASESASEFLLELITWALINNKNKDPFLYFCRSSLSINTKLLDIFSKKIIALDYKSCTQRINELCNDLDLDRPYIYFQYFKSIKKTQPAKISVFLENLNNPIKYEILKVALESKDDEIILKIDDYIYFSQEFKEYLFEYLYDRSDLLDKYLNLDNNFAFKVTHLKNLVLSKNKRHGNLKDSVAKMISKCKDSENFYFLYEIASNGEVRGVFKAICETKNQERIAQFMEKFKDDPYIRSLCAYF